MKAFGVEMFYISMYFLCYVIAQQLPNPTYAVAMSVYQIIRGSYLVTALQYPIYCSGSLFDV